jgi:integrase
MWRPATRLRPKFRTAYNLYRQEFKPLLKNAGLSGFTSHPLRHACATLLLTKNINPRMVQGMLGHATISQTMDTYSHVMLGLLAEYFQEV